MKKTFEEKEENVNHDELEHSKIEDDFENFGDGALDTYFDSLDDSL